MLPRWSQTIHALCLPRDVGHDLIKVAAVAITGGKYTPEEQHSSDNGTKV